MSTGVAPNDGFLPPVYDKLVPIEKLEYDQYNPRDVAPTDELVASIKRDGVQQSLIVWYDEEENVYRITDGWQRYQAATQVGWEALPVTVYEGVEEALDAIEAESIVREWSTYTWACYCAAIADLVEAPSYSEQVQKVAARVTKSKTSVDRYLAALSLPEETHVLLSDGPDGSEQDWQALSNYHEDVKRYGNLSWVVAAKLGRAYRAREISATRAIALAANAVQYEVDQGLSLVELGCDEPDWPIRTLHQRVQQDMTGTQYLQVPRVAVPLSKREKQLVMEYCRDNGVPLSILIKDGLQKFAENLSEESD